MTQLQRIAVLAICAATQLVNYLYPAKVSDATQVGVFCVLAWCSWAFVYCLITEAEDNGSDRRP